MLLDKFLANLAVRVEPFAVCQLSAGWRMRLPGLPGPAGVMLHFVLKGRGAVGPAAGDAQAVDLSWLCVVPTGMRHTLATYGAIHSEMQISFPPGGAPDRRIVAGSAEKPDFVVACGVVHAQYGPSLGLFDHLHEVLAVDLSGNPRVPAAFEGIFAEQSRPVAGGSAVTGALMTECLVYLLRNLSGDSAHPLPWLVALNDRRLARAIDAMLEKPGAAHTVGSLATAAAMSRSAFSVNFTAAFGRSPMSFLHHVRMQRSAGLLHADALSIDEVAREVGFSSRSHFSRAFKKHTGAPPDSFRQAARRRLLAAPERPPGATPEVSSGTEAARR